MTHIMRIDEFKLFNLFKGKKPDIKGTDKPEEKHDEANEKTQGERMVEFIEKNKDNVKWEYSMTEKLLKESFPDNFNEKLISDFRNAKWVTISGDDNVDKLENFMFTKHYEHLTTKSDSIGSSASIYSFSMTGENNDLDFLFIHYWDYPLGNATEDEEEEWSNMFIIGIISKKTKK